MSRDRQGVREALRQILIVSSETSMPNIAACKSNADLVHIPTRRDALCDGIWPGHFDFSGSDLFKYKMYE